MAQYYQCSKYPDHKSLDADYCSQCGAKISGAASPLPLADAPNTTPVAVQTVAASSAATVCPDCGTPRAGSAKFCEICRYNYDASASGAASIAPAPIAAAPLAPTLADPPPSVSPTDVPPVDLTDAPQADPTPQLDTPMPQAITPLPITVPTGVGSWELLVTVDPALYVEPDPNIPCPADEPERTFPIDFAENLIGRRSDRKDIHPEIPLTDPGVSHRHAKILRQADGAFVLLDVGSTNGTRLNGNPVAEGVRTALIEGDEITLGCWTRMRLQKVPL